MKKQERSMGIDDVLDRASELSDNVQAMIKLAWVGCMNLEDGCHYCFDPGKDAEASSLDQLEGIMVVLDECASKMESLDRMIDTAAEMYLKVKDGAKES